MTSDSITRGHDRKFAKNYCRLEVRRKLFTLRIVSSWNSLPADLVNAKSLNCFKNMLDQLWFDKRYIYD